MNTVTPRVLIVEDDTEVRRLVRRFLEGEGYALVEAATAEEALQSVRAARPSVAFCDVHLTGANGLWLAEQIRALSPATAMVLATGDANIPPTESLRPGVVSYLLKPFSREQVIAAVAAGLRWSQEAIASGADRRPRRLLDSGS